MGSRIVWLQSIDAAGVYLLHIVHSANTSKRALPCQPCHVSECKLSRRLLHARMEACCS
jgi:hypothetical protein